MPIKFKAPLDNTAKIISACVLAIFVLILLGQWLFVGPNVDMAIPAYVSAVLVLILIAVFSFRPVGYEVSSKGITVLRPLMNVIIPLHTIVSIEPLTRINSRGLIRLMGVGGVFGYYGNFRNRQLGEMKWYLSRRSNVVLLQTTDSKILLSPCDPESFIAEFYRATGFAKPINQQMTSCQPDGLASNLLTVNQTKQ